MKKLSCIISLFLLWLYAVPSHATIIITSIEARSSDSCRLYPHEPTGCYADYKLTWRRVPGPRDNEVIPPIVYFYGPLHEHNMTKFSCDNYSHGLFPGVPNAGCIGIPQGFTWKMIEELWIETYGPTGPGTAYHNGGGFAVSRECVMFAGIITQEIGHQANNGPKVCVGAPPTPDPQCVTEGNPVLNFDISLGQDTSGMQRETTINLRCNIPADVTLLDATGNSGRVELGWGYADVKINGQTLPVNLSPNPVLPLRITATLHGIATEAGVAEGNVIVVVGYQ